MQSSRKSSVSAAAPEVILTTPLDKDAGNAQSSEKPAADEKKVPAPKSLLQLLHTHQKLFGDPFLATCHIVGAIWRKEATNPVKEKPRKSPK